MNALPPLSLYVHIPWCVRKCPYCDFNSHESRTLPEQAYVEALLDDVAADAELAADRPLTSIFFGGGTPSLFQADSIARILEGVQARLDFSPDIEITLEANPGATEYRNLHGLKAAGVNRLSLGVQSFNNRQLERLGRIHSAAEALTAYEAARKAGFGNINLDLMHGLPEQSLEDAEADLSVALGLAPEHISWYQLTIEPNTLFWRRPPQLPEEDRLADINDMGLARLDAAGYRRYEISAFARPERRSRHNLNYWQFGDYLGIGAGAHGKITHLDGTVERLWKTRAPGDYLNAASPFIAGRKSVSPDDRLLEFLMNGLRLQEGVALALYRERAQLPPETLERALAPLRARALIAEQPERIVATPLGYRFLNDLLTRISDSLDAQ